MIYYKQNNECIEKYNITFDEEKLSRLKEVIIKECSFIEHKVVTSEYGAGYKYESLVKNLSYKKVGEHEYWEETRDIYRYTYDEYIPPRLVFLIDSLLKEYPSSIDEIFNYNINEDISFDQRVKKATEEFNKIDINSIYEKKEKLKEIDNLLKAKELNKDQKSIEPYYQELISLIHFELVDKLLVNDIYKVETFFDKEIYKYDRSRIRK